MTEVKITITSEDGQRLNFNIEGEGHAARTVEVQAGQELVQLIQDWCHKQQGYENIVPKIETLIPAKEAKYGAN
jgi:hypothetical protein